MKLESLLPLVLFVVFAATDVAFAQNRNRVSVSVSVNSGGTPGTTTRNDEEENADAFAVVGDADLGPHTGVSAASAEAAVNVGDISLLVGANTFGGNRDGGGGEAIAIAEAEWRDTFTLSTPDLPPDGPIKFNFLIFPKGILGVDANVLKHPPFPGQATPPDSGGNGEAHLEIYARNDRGTTDPMGSCLKGVCGFVDVSPLEFVNINEQPPGVIVASMTTPNNVDNVLTFSARIQVEAASGGGAFAEALGLFGGSIHWGGMENVRNALTGQPIANWTITSRSGFDYSQPFVPEPTSILLLANALCALPALRWRAHRD